LRVLDFDFLDLDLEREEERDLEPFLTFFFALFFLEEDFFELLDLRLDLLFDLLLLLDFLLLTFPLDFHILKKSKATPFKMFGGILVLSNSRSSSTISSSSLES
jgi:hypothetical protein